jgi:endo-1,4-beta-xylanase
MKKIVTVVSLAILWIDAVSCLAGQNVPALKDVFKGTFLIGGALNRPLVTGRDPNAAALAGKHFSTATPENDLKWQLVHPQPTQYNWEPGDSFVAHLTLARAGTFMPDARGEEHHLVHGLPAWLSMD